MRIGINILLAIFAYASVMRCQHIDWAENFQDVVSHDRVTSDHARNQMLNVILPRLMSEKSLLVALEIPNLVVEFNRRDDQIRLQASAILSVLAQFRSDSETVLSSALSALMEHTQDSEPRIRTNSVRTLCFLRPKIPDDELQFLIKLMSGSDESLADQAAFGVARMASSDPDAADAISDAILRSDRVSIRIAAIRAIPAGYPAIPSRLVSLLGSLLANGNPQVVNTSLETIRGLGVSAIRANLNPLK